MRFAPSSIAGRVVVLLSLVMLPLVVYGILQGFGANAQVLPDARAPMLSLIGVPLAIWAATVAFAYFALSRFVLRHVRGLRRQMRGVAENLARPPEPPAMGAPAEIFEMTENFLTITQRASQDADSLRAALDEQKALLREVHHRVKNNLQVVESLLNIQARSSDPQVAAAINKVHVRVANLAFVYQVVQEAESLTEILSDQLLERVFTHLAAGHQTNLHLELQPVTLLPDRAISLALWATEAAMRSLGDKQGLTVRFALEDGHGVLEVSGRAEGGDDVGLRLMEAFCKQLNGEVIFDGAGDVAVLRFPIERG